MKKFNINKINTALFCVFILTLSGCKIKKEVTITYPAEIDKHDDAEGVEQLESGTALNETYIDKNYVSEEKQDEVLYADNLNVSPIDFDFDGFAQVFLQVSSIADAEDYKVSKLGKYYYEKGNTVLIYSHADDGYDSVLYEDNTDGDSECYGTLLSSPFGCFSNGLGNSARRIFPAEELDTCSRSEAIEACREYAEACGYDDNASISTYAATLKAISEINEYHGNSISAPGEGYEVITRGQVEKLRDEGKEEEADELSAQMHDAVNRGLEWKKEHEAIILYYRMPLNGILTDGNNAGLEIIYVPYTKRVVLVSGRVPVIAGDVVGKTELVSKDAAVSQAAQIVGVRSQDDITIDAVTLIYSIQSINGTGLQAVPAWKIDYELNNAAEQTILMDTGTAYINAATGFVLQ